MREERKKKKGKYELEVFFLMRLDVFEEFVYTKR